MVYIEWLQKKIKNIFVNINFVLTKFHYKTKKSKHWYGGNRDNPLFISEKEKYGKKFLESEFLQKK